MIAKIILDSAKKIIIQKNKENISHSIGPNNSNNKRTVIIKPNIKRNN
jgi:hypothetical protein